jgi:drug/metabolite transporter (DMT)-like permease
MNRLDWGMLLSLSFLWGGSFFFTSLAARELPPLLIASARVTLGAIGLSLFVAMKGDAMPQGRWRDFMLLGFWGHAAPFTLIAWGQHFIPSGLASILNASTPFFTVLVLRACAPGYRIQPAQATGVVLGFLGVVALMTPKMTGVDLSAHAIDLGACLALLAAALCYGVSGWYVRRFADLPPHVTAARALQVCIPMTLPLALLIEQPWTLRPSLACLGSLAYLGFISTACAYLIFYPLIKRAGAANAVLVTLLVPVYAIILGAVFLDERLPAAAFIGMAVIFIGLGIIDGRPLAWLRGRTGKSQDGVVSQ